SVFAPRFCEASLTGTTMRFAMPTPCQTSVEVRVSPHGAVSRRGFLGRAAGGATALLGRRWVEGMSAFAGELRKEGRACILLWMAGGPSQFETFDPKPGAETQGTTRTIATTVPGLHIAEHCPDVARVMDQVSLIRSMTSSEGNHGRATYLLHTSYAP